MSLTDWFGPAPVDMTEWIGHSKVVLLPRSIADWFSLLLMAMSEWIGQSRTIYYCCPCSPIDSVLLYPNWLNRSIMFVSILRLFCFVSSWVFHTWSFEWLPLHPWNQVNMFICISWQSICPNGYVVVQSPKSQTMAYWTFSLQSPSFWWLMTTQPK